MKSKNNPVRGGSYKKVRDFVDQASTNGGDGYIDKLNDKEREWLYRFNQVYYIDAIKIDRDKEFLVPSKEAMDELGDSPTPLEYRRWLGRRNNKRNNDAYTVGNRSMIHPENIESTDLDPENSIIDLIETDSIKYYYETYSSYRKMGLADEKYTEDCYVTWNCSLCDITVTVGRGKDAVELKPGTIEYGDALCYDNDEFHHWEVVKSDYK